MAMTRPREHLTTDEAIAGLYTYRAEVARVVDGDTVDLAWVDLGFGVQLRPSPTEPLRMRLWGIDAYETTRRGGTTEEEKALGLVAKAWLAELVEGCTVRIRTVHGGDRGAFGRWLVIMWPDDGSPLANAVGGLDDSHSYNAQLIARGWAVPYAR